MRAGRRGGAQRAGEPAVAVAVLPNLCSPADSWWPEHTPADEVWLAAARKRVMSAPVSAMITSVTAGRDVIPAGSAQTEGEHHPYFFAKLRGSPAFEGIRLARSAPLFNPHFTPLSPGSSRTNQGERWFGPLTQKGEHELQ